MLTQVRRWWVMAATLIGVFLCVHKRKVAGPIPRRAALLCLTVCLVDYLLAVKVIIPGFETDVN
jgi:hypothetical protein